MSRTRTLTTARRTRHDAHLGLFHRDQLRHNGVTIRLYWFGPLFASTTTTTTTTESK